MDLPATRKAADHFKWKEEATCRASNSDTGHDQHLRSEANAIPSSASRRRLNHPDLPQRYQGYGDKDHRDGDDLGRASPLATS